MSVQDYEPKSVDDKFFKKALLFKPSPPYSIFLNVSYLVSFKL